MEEPPAKRESLTGWGVKLTRIYFFYPVGRNKQDEISATIAALAYFTTRRPKARFT
jgi:hypothetical protein